MDAQGEVADEALPMVPRAGEGSWESGMSGLQGAAESAALSGSPPPPLLLGPRAA